MCSGALFWAGVKRIVFAATAGDICASLGAPALPITAAEVLAAAEPRVSVEGPYLGDEAVAVLRAWREAR
jgi:tRNA(Arg) A34 adenosine deaminase TadA